MVRKISCSRSLWLVCCLFTLCNEACSAVLRQRYFQATPHQPSVLSHDAADYMSYLSACGSGCYEYRQTHQSAFAHKLTAAFPHTSIMPACRHFGSKVKLWATFNEPGVMGFCGWIYGTFPPAKTIQWATAGRHMCNMLRAHTAAYRAIKAMPGFMTHDSCLLIAVTCLCWCMCNTAEGAPTCLLSYQRQASGESRPAFAVIKCVQVAYAMW